MTKTFAYASGTVTVHGVENWPSERLVPVLTDYLTSVEIWKEEDDAA